MAINLWPRISICSFLFLGTIQTKGTTIKEALARFEKRTGQNATEAEQIKLIWMIPPIEKMDETLSTLTNCKKLSLSTNLIKKIENLNGLNNLKILSLGRNDIKSFAGLEAVGDTLEELWISYNRIEKLDGIHVLKKLRVLYMSNNMVKDKHEFEKLRELNSLEALVFVGNPLEENMEDEFRDYATKTLPKLKKLDGKVDQQLVQSKFDGSNAFRIEKKYSRKGKFEPIRATTMRHKGIIW